MHEFLPLFLEWMPEVTPLQKSKPLRIKDRMKWTAGILLIYLVMSQVRIIQVLKLDSHTLAAGLSGMILRWSMFCSNKDECYRWKIVNCCYQNIRTEQSRTEHDVRGFKKKNVTVKIIAVR